MSDATAAPVKPLPVPDEQSQPFWDATGRHELAIQRCQHCGQYAHPPVVMCEACLSTKPSFAFERVSGNGAIRTWTVMHMAFLPAFQADTPYVIAEVELAEQKGLTLLGRLVDGPDADIKLGMAVETVWDDVAPGMAVPGFKLAGGAQ